MAPFYCGRCSDPILDEDCCLCGKCGLRYHFNCSTIKKSTWVGYGIAKQKSWKCSKCRDQNLNIETGPSTPTREYDPGLAEINSKLDLILQRNEDNASEISLLKNVIMDLKEEIKTRDTIIKSLDAKIQIMEQYSRNKNIEVCNVPRTNNENLRNVVLKLAEKINVNLKDEDIDVVHRLPSKPNKTQPIIVQLSSRRIRDQIMYNRRKVITSNELVGEGSGKVFINPNLNRYFRELRFKTKKAAAEQGYKFVWFKNNKILVKENENSQHVITIQSDDDLEKLIRAYPRNGTSSHVPSSP